MVNLPPDQPNPSDSVRSVDESSPRGNRILDFDELLAVVLAFIGIGSVLWWGLSRNSSLWSGAERLQRRAGDAPAIALPGAADDGNVFEPRIFAQDEDLPRRGVLDSSGNGLGENDRPPDNEVRREAVPVPVPVAPTTTAPAATEEPSETAQPLTIADVPTTHWAYPFIKPMYDAGYLPNLPDSQFRPDQPLTRAEMAAMITQAFGNTSASANLAFSDVSSDYWAAAAINNAVAQGFMVGYPNGEFRPQRTIPRYEVIVALASGLNLTPPSAPEQTLQSFVDFSALPDWATPQVAAATENDIIVNYPARDQIKPAQYATRAEIVAMLHQALVKQGKLPAVQSEYTVP